MKINQPAGVSFSRSVHLLRRIQSISDLRTQEDYITLSMKTMPIFIQYIYINIYNNKKTIHCSQKKDALK